MAVPLYPVVSWADLLTAALKATLEVSGILSNLNLSKLGLAGLTLLTRLTSLLLLLSSSLLQSQLVSKAWYDAACRNDRPKYTIARP